MHQLADADDAGRTVDYWAAEGATSFKAYNYITADELKMAIRHVHFRGLKITGHLCSIGFKEAAEMGIDNLEHGIVVDTEFYSGKQPDVCPDFRAAERELESIVDISGPQVQDMIRDLVVHHVAVTSTLAILETSIPNRPPLAIEGRELKTVTTDAARSYLAGRARVAERGGSPKILQVEMQFEREFVVAGRAAYGWLRPDRLRAALFPGSAISATSSCSSMRAFRRCRLLRLQP